MNHYSKCFVLIFLVCCLTVMGNSPANSGLTVVQKLRFGEFIIHDNVNRHQINLMSDGSYDFSNTGLIEVSPPQTGVYNIDNLPPNTMVNVTASEAQPLLGGNNFFKFKNFQIAHDSTDASGTLIIVLGASVETSGNGLIYADDHYRGEINIHVNY